MQGAARDRLGLFEDAEAKGASIRADILHSLRTLGEAKTWPKFVEAFKANPELFPAIAGAATTPMLYEAYQALVSEEKASH